MAISVDVNNLGENTTVEKETKVIPKGFKGCRLASYIELGHHKPIFKGVPAKHEAGKNIGKEKDPEMMIHLVFEFPGVERTGTYPLCIKTSVPITPAGDLMNKLSVSRGIEEGWLSRSNALKSKFVKTLMAMQDAHKCTYGSLAEFVGMAFGCTVTHATGKAGANGDVPVYANMKLESLVHPSFEHPMTGAVESIDVPEIEGEYCPVFNWDSPDLESWKLIPGYLKKYMKSAVDFSGSPLEALIAGFEDDGDTDAPDDYGTDHEPPAYADDGPEIGDDVPF